MSFVVVGTNHKYSSIELRERLSFSKKRIRDALSLLKEKNFLKGSVIISTCNRVEIYASVDDLDMGKKEIEDFISIFHEIDIKKISSNFYIYEDREALRHLFLVACGLDSLILGETQILGQVKSAYFESESIDFVDKFLREIFNSVFSITKKIHTQTKISEGKTSVGSVAIDFIKERIGDLSGKNILIVGVGKVTELVLKYLKKENPKVLFVSSRTYEKAKELASQIKAQVVRFKDLRNFINKADVVISATASPHFIIRKDTLEGNINRELLIVDLALPRDVDPRVKEIKNVDLFCLEDFGALIERNIREKTKEANIAKIIVEKEVDKIWDRIQRQEFIRLAQEPALLP